MGQLSARLTRELTAHVTAECGADDDDNDAGGIDAESTLDAIMEWLGRHNACLTATGVKQFREKK